MAHLNLNDIDLEYEEFGDPSQPVIILIMGLGGQLLFWEQDFCEALADQGFRVIRFDNRDVGLSKLFDEVATPNFLLFTVLNRFFHYTLSPPYTLLDMVKDVIALMNALQIDSAHIVGMSMGGMIGQLLGIHYPTRVKSLTAIMSSSLNPTLPQPKLKIFWKSIMGLCKVSKGMEEAKIFALDFVRTIAGPQFPPDAKTIAVLNQCVERNRSLKGIQRQFMAVLAEPSLTKDLQKMQVPVLVIHGLADPLIPPECGKDIAKNAPHSSIKLIDGMGHFIPRVLYPEFVKLITDHAQKAA